MRSANLVFNSKILFVPCPASWPHITHYSSSGSIITMSAPKSLCHSQQFSYDVAMIKTKCVFMNNPSWRWFMNMFGSFKLSDSYGLEQCNSICVTCVLTWIYDFYDSCVYHLQWKMYLWFLWMIYWTRLEEVYAFLRDNIYGDICIIAYTVHRQCPGQRLTRYMAV